MKQSISFILAMLMIATPLSVLSVVLSSAEVTPVTPLGGGTFGGGDGSPSNPYIIEDALDLQAMNTHLSACYALGGNIDASETSGWNWVVSRYVGFYPVGDAGNRFLGAFDGRNYTISGLWIITVCSAILDQGQKLRM